MNSNCYKPDFQILDGIRGIAALYVVINHARGHMLQGGSELAAVKPIADWNTFEKIYYTVLQLTSIGTAFVIVFFVLSGFSIAYSLRNGQKFGQFYLKRIIRLYPPFLIALMWAYICYATIQYFAPDLNKGGHSVFHDWRIAINNLLYLNKGNYIPQFWSLIHEVLFYLIIPLALLRRILYYTVSLAAFICGLFIPDDFVTTSIVTVFIFRYHIYFVLGVFLYFNYERIKPYLLITNKVLMYTVFLVCFLTTIATNLLVKNDHITFTIAAAASLLMIVNFLEKKISNGFLRWIGAMSYTLYITHFGSIYIAYLLFVLLGKVSALGKITTWWIWPFGVIFSLVFSYIFYILVEKKTKLVLDAIRKKEK